MHNSCKLNINLISVSRRGVECELADILSVSRSRSFPNCDNESDSHLHHIFSRGNDTKYSCRE